MKVDLHAFAALGAVALAVFAQNTVSFLNFASVELTDTFNILGEQ